jgi:hypothetical protein
MFSAVSSEIFLIIRIQRDITINVHRSSYKVPVILARYYSNLNFLDGFSAKAKISSRYSESRVVPCGRTDGHNEAKSPFAILQTCLGMCRKKVC